MSQPVKTRFEEGEPTPHYADYCLMTDEELAAEKERLDQLYYASLSDDEIEAMIAAAAEKSLEDRGPNT